MKLGATINIGNFQNIRIDTGECKDYDSAITELIHICTKIEHPMVKEFLVNSGFKMPETLRDKLKREWGRHFDIPKDKGKK